LVHPVELSLSLLLSSHKTKT